MLSSVEDSSQGTRAAVMTLASFPSHLPPVFPLVLLPSILQGATGSLHPWLLACSGWNITGKCLEEGQCLSGGGDLSVLDCPSPKALIPTVPTLYPPSALKHRKLADTCSGVPGVVTKGQYRGLLQGSNCRTGDLATMEFG